jgi:hypothetical protein
VAANSEPLLNLREAARRLRMGESTLRQKLYAGVGPVAIKLPNSDQWKFRPADIDAYERAGEITPESLTSASDANQPDAPSTVAAVPRAPTRSLQSRQLARDANPAKGETMIPAMKQSPARKRERKPAPLEYLDKTPRKVPADRVLVHNQVRPVARRPGTRGSRIWLQVLTDNPRLEPCDCGWAPELGVHYRVVAPSAA